MYTSIYGVQTALKKARYILSISDEYAWHVKKLCIKIYSETFIFLFRNMKRPKACHGTHVVSLASRSGIVITLH